MFWKVVRRERKKGIEVRRLKPLPQPNDGLIGDEEQMGTKKVERREIQGSDQLP